MNKKYIIDVYGLENDSLPPNNHKKGLADALNKFENALNGPKHPVENTTKAAKCPSCEQYHLISCIDLFRTNKKTRMNFAELLIDGFDIIETTTEDAINNFGYC